MESGKNSNSHQQQFDALESHTTLMNKLLEGLVTSLVDIRKETNANLERLERRLSEGVRKKNPREREGESRSATDHRKSYMRKNMRENIRKGSRIENHGVHVDRFGEGVRLEGEEERMEPEKRPYYVPRHEGRRGHGERRSHLGEFGEEGDGIDRPRRVRRPNPRYLATIDHVPHEDAGVAGSLVKEMKRSATCSSGAKEEEGTKAMHEATTSEVRNSLPK